jgi:hypothetical protein
MCAGCDGLLGGHLHGAGGRAVAVSGEAGHHAAAARNRLRPQAVAGASRFLKDADDDADAARQAIHGDRLSSLQWTVDGDAARQAIYGDRLSFNRLAMAAHSSGCS